MRCRIRFGGRGHASNSLLLSINTLTIGSVFPKTQKLKNVIITSFFCLRDYSFKFKLDKDAPAVFGELRFVCMCVCSQGSHMAWPGLDCGAGACPSVPEGASGCSSTALVRYPAGLRRHLACRHPHPPPRHPHLPQRPAEPSRSEMWRGKKFSSLGM